MVDFVVLFGDFGRSVSALGSSLAALGGAQDPKIKQNVIQNRPLITAKP